MQTSKIPESVLNAVGEHCSSFILFYFDTDGNPAYFQSLPEQKDHMAMARLIEIYNATDGDMGMDDEEGDEEADK